MVMIIWTWVFNTLLRPFMPYLLVASIAGGLLGMLWAYNKGYASADGAWKKRELEQTIYAQAQTIARYRKATEEAQAQAALEAKNAQTAAQLIQDIRVQADNDEAALEQQLASAITDKEKLDAAIKGLRSKCVATGADVALDKRLRDQQQGGTGGLSSGATSRSGSSRSPSGGARLPHGVPQ